MSSDSTSRNELQPNRWAERWNLLRQAIAGGEQDYTQGSIRRAVVLLAVPMMLEMSMQSIFGVVDIFFVARLGAEAVAAVGLTEAVLTVLYAVAIGLSMGTTALVARRIGEKDVEGARVAAGQTMWIGAVVAVLIGLVGVTFADDILWLMGAEQRVIDDGASYTAIMLGGSITILFVFLLNAIFRGAGDATLAMRTLWLANGINIVLDPCLIYGVGPFPEMGIAGAATATNIGRGSGVIYQLYCLSGARGRIALRLRHLSLVLPVLLRLIRVSLAGVLQFFIATSSWVVLMRLVSPYGSAAIAGYTIGLRVLELTFLPAWGLATAAATLVGQNLGAGQPERAERSVWRAAKYNVVFLVSVAVVSIAFPGPIVRLFTDDPAVVGYGIKCLRTISYGYGFYAIGMVVTQAFNGAGDTDTPTAINFVCFWLLEIPLAYSLTETLGMGPDGVFVSIAIAESLVAALGLFAFRLGRWKLRVV